MINQTPEQQIRNYTFNEHRHRYAIWTVARAQRAFATNTVIADAIKKSDLRSFVEKTTNISQENFDDQHRAWCQTIISYFTGEKCKYRRAAKMVAIYLKTAVILPGNGTSQLCDVIHPPIDRVLLQCIAAKTPLKRFAKINWTTADHDTHWSIVRDLRETFGKCNWKIEEFWSLTDEA